MHIALQRSKYLSYVRTKQERKRPLLPKRLQFFPPGRSEAAAAKVIVHKSRGELFYEIEFAI